MTSSYFAVPSTAVPVNGGAPPVANPPTMHTTDTLHSQPDGSPDASEKETSSSSSSCLPNSSSSSSNGEEHSSSESPHSTSSSSESTQHPLTNEPHLRNGPEIGRHPTDLIYSSLGGGCFGEQKPESLCLVCGDRASGKHYGVQVRCSALVTYVQDVHANSFIQVPLMLLSGRIRYNAPNNTVSHITQQQKCYSIEIVKL